MKKQGNAKWFTVLLSVAMTFIIMMSCSQPLSSGFNGIDGSFSVDGKYTGGGYPEWVPGSVDPADGDRFEYVGHMFQAQNNPTAWDNPKIGGGWFWIDLGIIEGVVVDDNGTNTEGFTPVDPAVANTFPERAFVPYIDISKNGLDTLTEIYSFSGQKYFMLSFILAGNSGEPSWLRFDQSNINQVSGGAPMDSEFANVTIMNEINSIRAAGGEIAISFGGAAGTELASHGSYTDAAQIQAAYQTVIDKYNLTWMDMNIENSASLPNMEMRMTALKNLQIANPGLKISFQLVCLPTGLTDSAKDIVNKAKIAGVDIHSVGIMTMNFGSQFTSKSMGQYSINAAQATRTQLDDMELTTTQIGICPMIGQNDSAPNIFYLSCANEVNDWASTTTWVNWIAMWSVYRDKGGGIGQAAQYNCSGLDQEDWAFTNIFKSFGTTPAGPTPTPTATHDPSIPLPWEDAIVYTIGDLVTYGGSTYVCTYNHTSLIGWEPTNAPSLWALQ